MELNNNYDFEYYHRGLSTVFLFFLTWINLYNFKNYFKKNDLILEIGCGDGTISRWLSSKGFKIDALDISPDAIKLAKHHNSSVNYFVGDIFNFKSKIEKYDVVYSLHVMEHIKNIDDSLQEIHRILKNDGKLVIRIPNSDSFEAKIAGKKWFHYDEPYHVNHWGYGEFKDILVKNGFKDISVNYKLVEYKQVLLYSIMNYLGFRTDKMNIRILLLPLQIIFVPISIFLGFVFGNSGTVEIVAKKF